MGADEEVTFCNPRRDSWNPYLEQHRGNDVFREQVLWELNALERVDIIVLYLQPGTKSPISLLELGLHTRSGKLIVLCPTGFWRKGNVDMFQRSTVLRKCRVWMV